MSTYSCGVSARKVLITPTRPGLQVGLLGQVVGLPLQHVEPDVAAVFDHQLEAAGVAQPVDRRRTEHRDLRLLDLGIELLAQASWQSRRPPSPGRADRGTARE